MTSKPRSRTFRFRLGKGDQDIADYLDALPPRTAAATIKYLLRQAAARSKPQNENSPKTTDISTKIKDLHRKYKDLSLAIAELLAQIDQLWG